MKKVLIVTYYWPPSAGGGIQRWLKFSKYLPEYGWQPIIFTPEDPDFQIKDPSLAADISEETEVLKFPIWEPYSLFDNISGHSNKKNRQQGVLEGSGKSFFSGLSRWIRGNVFIPDPKVSWVRPSVGFLIEYIRDNSIDHVVTTGPPHSMHLIGLKLKRKTGVCWIADFRDPWVRWDMMKKFNLSWLAKRAHKKLESKVVRHADVVITVSETWANEIKTDHGSEAKVITNGFDHMDFEESTTNPVSDKFIISHSGLVNEFRNPQSLWSALRELCQEDEDFAELLQIEFCGMVHRQVLEIIQSDKILGPKFKFKDYVSHLEVLRIYNSSSVLLLLLNDTDNAKGHLPGKLFEYLASNRNILAMGDIEGDSSKIIQETKTGITCDPEDVNSIKKAISSFFTHFKNGTFPNSVSIEQYSRKALTGKLVEVLEQL
jgi:glycosyltransferase involved in cell wall biosynthesis